MQIIGNLSAPSMYLFSCCKISGVSCTINLLVTITLGVRFIKLYCLDISHSFKRKYWRSNWQPTPLFLPGESQGQRSLLGCSPWGCEESDMTEWLHFHYKIKYRGYRHFSIFIYFLWLQGKVIWRLNQNFWKSSVSSVQFLSYLTLCKTMDYSTPGFPVHNQLTELAHLMSIKSVMSSKHLILCCPHLLLPSIFPASRSFPKSQFFTSGGQSIAVSDLASFFPMNIQGWFPLYWLVGSPWGPTDSQESSPTPQFKSINTLVKSFLYSPNVTSKHDCWKNHSFD